MGPLLEHFSPLFSYSFTTNVFQIKSAGGGKYVTQFLLDENYLDEKKTCLKKIINCAYCCQICSGCGLKRWSIKHIDEPKKSRISKINATLSQNDAINKNQVVFLYCLCTLYTQRVRVDVYMYTTETV